MNSQHIAFPAGAYGGGGTASKQLEKAILVTSRDWFPSAQGSL